MSKPILYGLHLSPPFRAVLLVAKAINLDLEIYPINLMANEHKTPEYLKLNPQGTIPILNDEGAIICDSHAIVTYLVDKYAVNDSLYPKDLVQRAQVDQCLHFDAGILFVRMRAITERIVYFNEPIISNEKVLALEQAYRMLEKFLGKYLYLCGDNVTVADMCCIATVSSCQGILPLDHKKFPQTAAWMSRMEELSYYEETNGKGARELIDFLNQRIEELTQ